MIIFFCQYVLLFILLNRCLAPRDDFDCPDQSYCCIEHTNILLDAWPTLKLWDEYGIVNNIKVSFVSLQSFTTHFPWVDIYEMITPDLLHQVIKGAFKDHVIEWVHTHGEAQANRILEDIDQR